MEVKKIIPPVLILVLFLGSWHVGALIYNMAFLLSISYAVLQTFIQDFNIIMIGLAQTFKSFYRLHYCYCNRYCSCYNNEFEQNTRTQFVSICDTTTDSTVVAVHH